MERDFTRFSEFLDSLENEVYEESASDVHKILSIRNINAIKSMGACPKDSKVLDVGYGMGYASEHFQSIGCDVTAITLHNQEIEKAELCGTKIIKCDQSFTDFEDESFNLVWARHVLEHSAVPLFTIMEFCRIIKHDGFIYIEVPEPDTVYHHEDNPNHYSVFTKLIWESLFKKAQLMVYACERMPLEAEKNGKDYFMWFLCKKSAGLFPILVEYLDTKEQALLNSLNSSRPFKVLKTHVE